MYVRCGRVNRLLRQFGRRFAVPAVWAHGGERWLHEAAGCVLSQCRQPFHCLGTSLNPTMIRPSPAPLPSLVCSPFRDLAGQVFLAERRLHWWQQENEDASAHQAQQAQQRAQQAQQQQPASREELQALPVRELKAHLAAAGIDSSGCAEKGELIDLLLANQQRQDGGGSSGNGGRSGSSAEQLRRDAGGAAAGAAQEQRPTKQCLFCGATSVPDGRKLKLCAGCRAVHFCSVDCQRAAWPGHRQACQAAQAAALDAEG